MNLATDQIEMLKMQI